MNSREAWKKLYECAEPEDLGERTEWISVSFNQFRRFWLEFMADQARVFDAYLEFGGLPKPTLQQMRDECTE